MYQPRYHGSHPVFLMTRTWFNTMTSRISTIMIRAVSAPGLELISDATRRSIGILSIVRFVRTPVQYGARYQTDASMGAFRNAGRVNRNASRQNA